MIRFPLLAGMLMLFLATGCGRAKKQYEKAKNEPVHKIDLTARIRSITKQGDDFKYVFVLENNTGEAQNIRPDFQLISGDLEKTYTHNLLELDIPRGTSATSFATPFGPASVVDRGSEHFVFRAYTYQEELLVRELNPVPQEVQNMDN